MIGCNRIEAFGITEAKLLLSIWTVLLRKGSGLELPTKIGDVHLSSLTSLYDNSLKLLLCWF